MTNATFIPFFAIHTINSLIWFYHNLYFCFANIQPHTLLGCTILFKFVERFIETNCFKQLTTYFMGKLFFPLRSLRECFCIQIKYFNSQKSIHCFQKRIDSKVFNGSIKTFFYWKQNFWSVLSWSQSYRNLNSDAIIKFRTITFHTTKCLFMANN